jgi:regulator of replication initiation timing
MNKEELLNSNEFEGLNASEIWAKLYNKELNSKKNILEYIDMTRVLKKGSASGEQIEDTYNYIYEHIESLRELIKPNTIMYLENTLKSQLGKYVKEKDPKPVNHFIEFFKAAYPENNRRKDFTWVLMDINSISEEQAWTTLTYINKECLSHNLRLNSNQKRDIVKVVEKLVGKNNIKFINNIKSLKQFTDILGISIVKDRDKFKVKYLK